MFIIYHWLRVFNPSHVGNVWAKDSVTKRAQWQWMREWLWPKKLSIKCTDLYGVTMKWSQLKWNDINFGRNSFCQHENDKETWHWKSEKKPSNYTTIGDTIARCSGEPKAFMRSQYCLLTGWYIAAMYRKQHC